MNIWLITSKILILISSIQYSHFQTEKFKQCKTRNYITTCYTKERKAYFYRIRSVGDFSFKIKCYKKLDYESILKEGIFKLSKYECKKID